MPGKPFVHGDPRAGRPRGAKNKLAVRVLADLLSVWNEPIGEGSDVTKGVAALRIMAVEDPGCPPNRRSRHQHGLFPRQSLVVSFLDKR
jgi:hypothetical protein